MGESLKTAYDQSFEKYNLEDGNFELAEKADSECISSIESENVTLFENFYVEKNTDDFDSTLRIFADRKDVNKVCLLSGEIPEVVGKSLKVVGIAAPPDYSVLFQNNTDFMFDSIKFGVAVMTDESFQTTGDSHIHYSYSWKK